VCSDHLLQSVEDEAAKEMNMADLDRHRMQIPLLVEVEEAQEVFQARLLLVQPAHPDKDLQVEIAVLMTAIIQAVAAVAQAARAATASAQQ
jgi:hypothetical protein